MLQHLVSCCTKYWTNLVYYWQNQNVGTYWNLLLCRKFCNDLLASAFCMQKFENQAFYTALEIAFIKIHFLYFWKNNKSTKCCLHSNVETQAIRRSCEISFDKTSHTQSSKQCNIKCQSYSCDDKNYARTAPVVSNMCNKPLTLMTLEQCKLYYKNNIKNSYLWQN